MFQCVAQLIFLGGTFYGLFRRHPDQVWDLLLTTSIFLTLLFGLFGFLYWDNRRIRNLLRFGDAYVATVIAVEKGVHYSRVHSVYLSKEGKTTEAIVQVHPDIVASENLTPQTSFTLLVSPDNPKQFMPYFLATRTFSVIPIDATQVSREVSARVAAHRVAAQAASLPAQFSGRFRAVEPELTGLTPRNAALNAKSQRHALWLLAFATVYLPMFYALPNLLHIGSALYASLFMGSNMIFMLIVSPAMAARNQKSLLEVGTPIRAIIVDEEDRTYDANIPLPMHDIRFTYRRDGNDASELDTFTIKRSRAWQLGLKLGAVFTLLSDPKNPIRATPYFEITDAEIVGAMGAKITPP